MRLTNWGERKENTATHNNHKHITMVPEGVGMCYSLAVLFQGFPVVKRRENRTVVSKDNWYRTHHWVMWKRVGLTDYSGRKSKQQCKKHDHITTVPEYMWQCITHFLLYSMCIPVVKMKNMAVISKNNRYCTHHWGMWKRVGLTVWGGRKAKTATHNNHNHIIMVLEGYVAHKLLCSMCSHRVVKRKKTLQM